MLFQPHAPQSAASHGPRRRTSWLQLFTETPQNPVILIQTYRIIGLRTILDIDIGYLVTLTATSAARIIFQHCVQSLVPKRPYHRCRPKPGHSGRCAAAAAALLPLKVARNWTGACPSPCPRGYITRLGNQREAVTVLRMQDLHAVLQWGHILRRQLVAR